LIRAPIAAEFAGHASPGIVEYAPNPMRRPKKQPKALPWVALRQRFAWR
jgi:hypothetical protein